MTKSFKTWWIIFCRKKKKKRTNDKFIRNHKWTPICNLLLSITTEFHRYGFYMWNSIFLCKHLALHTMTAICTISLGVPHHAGRYSIFKEWIPARRSGESMKPLTKEWVCERKKPFKTCWIWTHSPLPAYFSNLVLIKQSFPLITKITSYLFLS